MKSNVATKPVDAKRFRGTPMTDPRNAALVAKGDPFVLDGGDMVIPRATILKVGAGNEEIGRREIRSLIAAEIDRKVDPAPVVWPPTVRIATEVDEPAIMELLLADVRENAEKVAPAAPDRILRHVQCGTRKQGGFVLVIDGADKKPVAVSILVPMQWWWSNSFYYQDMVTYVHPEHRTSRHAHSLIAAQQWLVEKQSAEYGSRVFLMCGVLGLVRTRVKTVLWRRKMRQVGWAYIWPCPWDDETRVS